MSIKEIKAAIDKSDLKTAASLIERNPELANTPIHTINTANTGGYPTPLSYLLYKLSSGTFKFGGIFSKDLKPLQTILGLFKRLDIRPSPRQDVATICRRITDKGVLKVIYEFYDTNCNVPVPVRSPSIPPYVQNSIYQHGPLSYSQSYPQYVLPPQEYPVKPGSYPYVSPVKPGSYPYVSPGMGYYSQSRAVASPAAGGRQTKRNKYYKKTQRTQRTQKTQRTQRQKRKSNK